MSSVIRVPDNVHLESKQIASVRGQQQGQLLAEAWREYLATHREEFARDLETAANLLRDGTLEDLAAFASRNVSDRARAAAAKARGED
jgi:hypothetical protein